MTFVEIKCLLTKMNFTSRSEKKKKLFKYEKDPPKFQMAYIWLRHV